MTLARKCPLCGKGTLQERTRTSRLEYKGVDLQVSGLRFSICSQCEAEQASPEQLDSNNALVKAEFIRTKRENKQEKGLLPGYAIRSLREMLGLTQQDAARLFGGGPNAFSKYENEEVVQSVGMDRLLRLVSFRPSLLPALAEVAGAWLSQKALDASILHSGNTVPEAQRSAQSAHSSIFAPRHIDWRSARTELQRQAIGTLNTPLSEIVEEPTQFASAWDQQRPGYSQ